MHRRDCWTPRKTVRRFQMIAEDGGSTSLKRCRRQEHDAPGVYTPQHRIGRACSRRCNQRGHVARATEGSFAAARARQKRCRRCCGLSANHLHTLHRRTGMRTIAFAFNCELQDTTCQAIGSPSRLSRHAADVQPVAKARHATRILWLDEHRQKGRCGGGRRAVVTMALV